MKKATPLPWSEDDGNIFSQPLGTIRHEAIMKRVNGDKSIPHPDKGLENPLGWVATTQQAQPNFENDSCFIVEAVNAIPELLAEIEWLRAIVEGK